MKESRARLYSLKFIRALPLSLQAAAFLGAKSIVFLYADTASLYLANSLRVTLLAYQASVSFEFLFAASYPFQYMPAGLYPRPAYAAHVSPNYAGISGAFLKRSAAGFKRKDA
jgi:hypothetical protein